MDAIPVTFTDIQVTALIELYARWLDAKDPHPILGDPWADRIVRSLDFDFSEFKKGFALSRYPVGERSRTFDRWVAEYLSENPDAIVLDLGCGLDSRVIRVDPAPGHLWYDVDLQGVIEIADRLYPERAEHCRIAASAVDPDWLARIPGDRPVVVVADGLLMFLAEDEVRRVFQQIIDHFPRGQFVFNAYAPLIKERGEKRPEPVFEKYGVQLKWTIENARGVEKLDDRLHYVDEHRMGEGGLLAHASLYYRLLVAVINVVPAWRNSGWILRYRF
ncbi:class I SAM-dependent methyltransferase [Actinopolymorpha alba]|uniref:class I SAM-dependent methyltransferase n=1 Tax=Actinopolymorpha alba TaxID=533267 RepID=UPI000360D3B8|nr:class I SAM-dependent methyltransferase [Actinopolymorpha alba]